MSKFNPIGVYFVLWGMFMNDTLTQFSHLLTGD